MKPAAERVIQVFAWVVVRLLPRRLVRAIQRDIDHELFALARRKRC